MDHLKQFLNCRVLITRANGARYAGCLVGFKQKERKFCLSNLAIVNREGAYTTSGPPESRWFKADQFSVAREHRL